MVDQFTVNLTVVHVFLLLRPPKEREEGRSCDSRTARLVPFQMRTLRLMLERHLAYWINTVDSCDRSSETASENAKRTAPMSVFRIFVFRSVMAVTP